MKLVEPKVFLIGRSCLNPKGVKEWLTTLGVSPQAIEKYISSSLTPGESIVQLAGKRCYNAFEVGLNKNITKIREDIVSYIDNILSSRHGNILEHVTYSFAIENVSRIFSSEFNRHRAGMAISEGSMRYIRYSDIPFWMPTSLIVEESDSPKLIGQKLASQEIFKDVFSYMETNYKKLEAIWELDTSSLPFSYKKKLTSLFRRIIGMGVATGGVWTGNIRALRHICELRSDPHVEEEMILVVSMILNILLEYESNLFGDFSFEEGYWKPQYSKV